MLYLIIFVLVAYIIFQHHELKHFIKIVEKESPVLVRYQEACRWLASHNVNGLDLALYARHEKSEAMKKWEAASCKNTLDVSQFREYVNDQKLSTILVSLDKLTELFEKFKERVTYKVDEQDGLVYFFIDGQEADAWTYDSDPDLLINDYINILRKGFMHAMSAQEAK